MKKLRIYLDTSVISFLFADDAPAYRDITREFFDMHLSRFDVLISDTVLFEIDATQDVEKRTRLQQAISSYGLHVAELDAETKRAVDDMAACYVKQGAIPASKREDALHVAMAVMMGTDVLLSWNFRHLANAESQAAINEVNHRHGLGRYLLILTPLGVMGHETEH